ncbi:MAG: hypothetical protein KDC69_01890, partial [Flavobacteriaceae bacterium]|nr:hypothetical protein [Flavobacteriaceae bacterium]
KMKLFIAGLLFVGISTVAMAQTTPVVDKREKNQKVRVAEGVKSGELTKRETRKLARQQRHIKKTEKAAKADGKVTAQERRQLKREQRRANANIYRKKHNKRDRN